LIADRDSVGITVAPEFDLLMMKDMADGIYEILFGGYTDYRIDDLPIDVETVHANGANFVVGTLAIGNSDGLGLNRVDQYSHSDNAWDIWLYYLGEK
jgi:hypothetical protein